jgi:pilus assembly protein Flp/PilA
MIAFVARTVTAFRDDRFVREEDGATAIEYALIIALIALACIVTFNATGGGIGNTWNSVANTVANAMK